MILSQPILQDWDVWAACKTFFLTTFHFHVLSGTYLKSRLSKIELAWEPAFQTDYRPHRASHDAQESLINISQHICVSHHGRLNLLQTLSFLYTPPFFLAHRQKSQPTRPVYRNLSKIPRFIAVCAVLAYVHNRAFLRALILRSTSTHPAVLPARGLGGRPVLLWPAQRRLLGEALGDGRVSLGG